MLKVTVLAHRSVMDDMIARMQSAGVVDIGTAPVDLPTIELPPNDERVRQLEERLARAAFVRDFLSRYHPSDQPFSVFVSEKVHISAEEYRALESGDMVAALYEQCEEISSRMAMLQRERARLLELAQELAPWERLR